MSYGVYAESRLHTDSVVSPSSNARITDVRVISNSEAVLQRTMFINDASGTSSASGSPGITVTVNPASMLSTFAPLWHSSDSDGEGRYTEMPFSVLPVTCSSPNASAESMMRSNSMPARSPPAYWPPRDSSLMGGY